MTTDGSGPDLPSELQTDQDRFYQEVMGPVSEMFLVEQWHSTSAARVTFSPELQAWCHLINIAGTVGIGDKVNRVQLTIAIPLDSAKRIGTNMIRSADLSEEELEREGRHI